MSGIDGVNTSGHTSTYLRTTLYERIARSVNWYDMRCMILLLYVCDTATCAACMHATILQISIRNAAQAVDHERIILL